MRKIAEYLYSFGVGKPKKIKPERYQRVKEWEEKMKEGINSEDFAERRKKHKKNHNGYDPNDWIY